MEPHDVEWMAALIDGQDVPCYSGSEHDYVDLPQSYDSAFSFRQCRACALIETTVHPAELEKEAP